MSTKIDASTESKINTESALDRYYKEMAVFLSKSNISVKSTDNIKELDAADNFIATMITK